MAPGARPTAGPGPSARALLTTRLGHLALAMLMVELLAGMQTYLNQTVLPLLATDLGARDSYGLVTAAAQVPAFLTMPLGGAMLARWRASHLMTSLTALLVAGAVVGALAPTISVYVLGEVLRGLAAGALATVTMGVMVAGLPDAWRRLFMAAGSGMWVVAALAGPVYASSVSAMWGWRWALVAYLPLLVAARLAMAGEVRDLRVDAQGEAVAGGPGGAATADADRVPWVPALALAGGVALVGAVRASSAWFWPGAVAGAALVAWACGRVFPAGTLRLVPGRRAGIATLTWVCGLFFAADYLVAPTAHDVLGLGAAATGWALTAGGIGWSAVAIWCGAHPARRPGAYVRRTSAGAACFAVGLGVMAAAVAGAGGGAPGVLPWWGLHLGYGLASVGMGLIHLDTMNRIVSDPPEPDGITHAQAATAVTIAGAAGGAVLGTLTTSFVAPTTAGVEAGLAWPVLVVLAVGLAATPLLTRRAA